MSRSVRRAHCTWLAISKESAKTTMVKTIVPGSDNIYQ